MNLGWNQNVKCTWTQHNHLLHLQWHLFWSRFPTHSNSINPRENIVEDLLNIYNNRVYIRCFYRRHTSLPFNTNCLSQSVFGQLLYNLRINPCKNQDCCFGGHRELGRRSLGRLACIESRKDWETNKPVLYFWMLAEIWLQKHLHIIRSVDTKLVSNGPDWCVAVSVGHHPTNAKVADLSPSQGPWLVGRPAPHLGICKKHWLQFLSHNDGSLPLFLPPFPVSKSKEVKSF